MRRVLPFVVAVLSSVLWFTMLVAFPHLMDMFADFKMQMPALTVLWVNFYHGGGHILMALWVLAVAAMLVMRWRLGSGLALALSVLLDSFCLATILPLIALSNNLSESDEAPASLATFLHGALPTWLLILLGFNQLVKLALFFNWRAFFVR